MGGFSSLVSGLRGSCGRRVEAALQKLLREKGYADFDRLVVEAYIEAPLVNEEPLHIGAGAESLISPVDLAVVRVRRRLANGEVVEEPVIPGSSLKGVLRSLVEAYAAARGLLDPVVEVCGVELLCTGEGLSGVEEFLRRRLCDCISDDNEARAIDDSLYERCIASPVVGLFGAPWLASHLKLFDAKPLDGEVRVSVASRVAIDRFTGGQAPGLLYHMEYVEPGYRWRFRMLVYNVTPGDGERWELLRYIFESLERGVLVGRRTSAGMGLVRLLVDEGKVRLLEARKGRLASRELGIREWLKGEWWGGRA